MHGVLGSKFKKATNAIVKKITICNWVVHVHAHVSMTHHHVNEPLVSVSMHSIYVSIELYCHLVSVVVKLFTLWILISCKIAQPNGNKLDRDGPSEERIQRLGFVIKLNPPPYIVGRTIRAFHIFQVCQHFTIYRWYFFLESEHFA